MKTYSRIREQGTPEIVPGNPVDRINAIRAVVKGRQYAKVDGHMLDHFTASMLCQVYDKLEPKNKIKFAGFPVNKMASIGWKLCK